MNFESERRSTIISVFGVKGSGKTNWIKYYIYTHPEKKYLIVDHHYEHKVDNRTVLINSVYDLAYHEHTDFNRYNKVILRGKVDYNEFWTFAETCRTWCIVFDEIDKSCSPTSIPIGLYNICQFGRHIQVDLIAGARRPANVHRDVTSQSDLIIVHRVREPRDIKYVQDFCGEEIAKICPNLKLGEFVRYPQPYDEMKTEEINLGEFNNESSENRLER